MKHCLSIILMLLSAICTIKAQETDNTPATPKTTVTKEDKIAAKPEPIINPALIFGFNASQVWGDQITGYRKFGANAGAGAFIRLPKHFSVSFEILYSMKGSTSGSNETVQDSGHVYNNMKIILDYIDVPIMFSYHDKKRAIFGAGVNYTSLVRFKNIRQDQKTGINTEYVYASTPYKTAGLEFVANVTFIFAKHYGVNLRYNLSLTNINKTPISYSTEKSKAQQNDYLTMRFMYFFK